MLVNSECRNLRRRREFGVAMKGQKENWRERKNKGS